MHRNLLRTLRIGAALVVLLGFVAAFADFRNLLPAGFARGLASAQFGPSLVALILGAGFSAGLLLAVGLALVAGRVYCSALCPLGILQDVVIRVSGLFRRKGWFLRHARAHNAWRHGFLAVTVVAVLAGWGGLALTLLDPYSNFGRVASGVLRPLLVIANNAVAGVANAVGLPGVYRVEVPWAGAGALILIGAFSMLVIVMAVLRGRLYCNTVCPVGTLLGLISRRAMFRLRIDQSNCRKCGVNASASARRNASTFGPGRSMPRAAWPATIASPRATTTGSAMRLPGVGHRCRLRRGRRPRTGRRPIRDAARFWHPSPPQRERLPFPRGVPRREMIPARSPVLERPAPMVRIIAPPSLRRAR